MASFDRNLNMFRTSDGLYFATQAEASSHESGAAAAPANNTRVDTTDFQNNQSTGQTTNAQKPIDPNDSPNPNNPGGMSNNDLWNAKDQQRDQARATANTNAGTGGGLGTAQGAIRTIPRRTTGVLGGQGFTDSHGRQYQVMAQSADKDAAYEAALGTVNSRGMVGGTESLALTPPAAPPAAPSPGTTAATEQTQRAGNEYRETSDANAAEADNLWKDVRDRYNALDDPDNALGDEARGYQREGLQQQRMLLEKLLGVDPNQYATQFADQALARTIAAGRSTSGGAAAQQAGMFAAMDQAPSLYAEGARQASSLENQRLSAAAGVTKSFGDLGTLTRGQDENRTQFESNLSLSIADSIAKVTQGQVSLNEAESQRFAQVYVDFAQLAGTYAGMDSAEQMHQLDLMFKDKELSQQWDMFKAQMNANGSVSPKDIIGGLFQLGGGLISSGGSILAANARSAA